jgi:hypothetical protein
MFFQTVWIYEHKVINKILCTLKSQMPMEYLHYWNRIKLCKWRFITIKTFCGIQIPAERLFKSHLPDSKQEVKVKSPISNFNSYSYWGTVKYAFKVQYFFSQLSLIHISDLLRTINPQTRPILFSDTSISTSHPYIDYFFKYMKDVLAWTNGLKPINLHWILTT